MKKIMFNDRYGLTQAVLDGKKTMTRRIIKPQPIPPSENYRIDNSGTLWEQREYDERWGGGFYEVSHGKINTLCAPYKADEIVAVAQSYENCGYRPDEIVWKRKDQVVFLTLHVDKGWKNKMFVRADMMPRQIRITKVRAERLQAISDEDCLREGIMTHPDINTYWFTDNGVGNHYPSLQEAYAFLLHTTNSDVRYCNFRENVKEGLRRIKSAFGYSARLVWFWIAARTIGRFITK